MSDKKWGDYVKVTITNSDGKRETISVQDAAKGGIVSDVREVGSGQLNNKTVYKAAGGSWKGSEALAKADTSTTSVSLDKNTGKITITAPSATLEDSSFKEIVDSDYLKQLSAAYKTNPDYKVPDPFNQDDEDADISIPDLIDKINESAKKTQTAINEENAYRRNIAEGMGGYGGNEDLANRLTRNDFITMSNTGTGDGANDDSLISIPKSMYADVNFLESFDADTGTVKRGDFQKNFYNLEKHTQEELDKFLDKIDNYWDGDNDNFSDTDEYARMSALKTYIDATDPEMNFWQQANYNVSAAGEGIKEGIVNLANNIAQIGTNIANFLTGSQVPYENIDADYKFQEELRNEKAADFYKRWSSSASAIRQGGSFVAEMGADIAVSSALVSGLGTGVAAVAGAAKAGVAAAKATKAGVKAAETAAKIAAAGEKAKTAVQSAVETAEAIQKISNATMALKNTEAAAKLTADATKVLNASGKAIGKTATAAQKVAKTLSEVAAETVIDSALSDPVVLAKVLQSVTGGGKQTGTVDDAYGSLMETAAWNLGGWGTFAGAKKIIKEFGQTTAGRYTNAVAQKYINKISAGTGNASAKILKLRYGDDYLNASRSAYKNEARKANALLRQQQKVIGSQKIGVGKNAMKNVEKQERNIQDYIKMQLAIDARKAGSQSYIRKTLQKDASPILNSIDSDMREIGSNITQLERKAGLSSRRRFRNAANDSSARVFSKETSNYLAAKTELRVLENIETSGGILTKAQKEGKVKLEAMLKNAQEKMPEGLQREVDKYLDKQREFYYNYVNQRVREGSLDADEIEYLRSTGRWGENGEEYVPVYRTTGDKEYAVVRMDGRRTRDVDTGTDSYIWGSERDFVDPEIARYMYMTDGANKLASKQFAGAFKGSSQARLINSADELKRADRMKKIKTPLGERIMKTAKGTIKNGSAKTSSELGDRVVRLQRMREAFVSQQGKTQAAALKEARAKVKTPRTLIRERNTAINTMTSNELDDVLRTGEYPMNFSDFSSDAEFIIFYNSLDNKTKSLISDRLSVEAGNLYSGWDTQAIDLDLYRTADMVSARQAAVAEQGEDLLKQTGTKKLGLGLKDKGEDIAVEIPRYSKATTKIDTSSYTVKNKPYLTANNYNRVASADGGFVDSVKQSVINNDKSLRDSETIVKRVEEQKQAKLIADTEGLHKEELDKLSRIAKAGVAQGDKEAILKEFDNVIDEFANEVYEDKAVSQTLDDIIAQAGDSRVEDAKEYIVMSEMLANKAAINKELWAAKYDNSGIKTNDEAADLFDDMFWDKVTDRRNAARQSLADHKSTLIDQKDWYEEIRKLDAEITGRLKSDGYVQIANDKGQMEMWQVDPLVADLYSYSTGPMDMAGWEKVLNESAKIFRLNTTGLNITSFVNQSIRDFGNLWLTTGSFHLVNLSRSKIRKEFGEEIAEWYSREEPEIMRELLEHRKIDVAEFNAVKTARKGENYGKDMMNWYSERRLIGDNTFDKLYDKGLDLERVKREKAAEKAAKKAKKSNEPVKEMSAEAEQFWGNIEEFGKKDFQTLQEIFEGHITYENVEQLNKDAMALVGGLDNLAKTDPEAHKEILERANSLFATLRKTAEEKGEELFTTGRNLMVERELNMGFAASTSATETAFLKGVGNAKQVQRVADGDLAITNTWIDRAVDKLGMINEKRERYYRNVVYADSLNQALEKGMTLKDARSTAEFMMANGTTNFQRQLVHLQRLQRTVPYLGAAVNGTKSFWRMLSIDPVGVASRFMGGFVLPTMAFTGSALANPETREKYKQLSEYEKDNNIIIGCGNQLMKIPVPQEIGSLVNPWRQFVEKVHDGNRHDFWELMLNDALGVLPYDLSGYYDLDADSMEDPTIWDRLDQGSTRLIFGQLLANPVVKTIYMANTGKDPYTGKFIDTSYSYYDEDAGTVVIMDSNQSAFAKTVSKLFGTENTGVLAACLTSLLGRTGSDLLNIITDTGLYAVTNGKEGNINSGIERISEAMSSPLTVSDYSRTKSAWNRELSKLYAEKEAIQNDDKFKEIDSAIQQETDQQKLKSLKAQREDMLAGWKEHIQTAVEKFKQNYGGKIDRFRVASLMSLVNLHETTGGLTPEGKNNAQELYYEGRDEAINTLLKMGVNASEDRSILGYQTRVKNDDGTEETVTKFYKPLEILAMQSTWYGQGSANKAYIQGLLEDGATDYKSELKQVKELRNQIYDKGSLTQSDYAKITAIELEWNARVMEAVAPYVERMTPEGAINNDEVLEYLSEYILVPSDFKKDKYGKYVTNKKLNGGDATKAYVANYIRSIFKVNNSQYSSGKNYSGRKNLGE